MAKQRSAASPAFGQRGVPLAPLSFADLPGFAQDSHLEAFKAFAASCAAIAAEKPPLRPGVRRLAALESIARRALGEEITTQEQARLFFEGNFRPFRILAGGAAAGGGLLTGYYEPVVPGSPTKTAQFRTPILARPDNLAILRPYHSRTEIEAGMIDGHTRPLVFLRDAVEAFLVHVQGSARVRLRGGRVLRLTYAGRNGHPYTSIGRILIESGEIAEEDMSLAALKAWIRANGQNPGEPGWALMQRNRSYIFFAAEEENDPGRGPVGAEGVPLTPLRSIAIDRAIWSYGLPFWIEAALPWRGPSATPFQRLLIAQDTGSAIRGPARADIFFGSGDGAGARAGDIRHKGEMAVLLPVREA